ncbi:MAG: family 20 glycosylhydrolase, partial [Candidatus Izemoplasmatales bacterium]|nr:family 20 glycosylhydrolase [Candidatus Izemoplasmatales bacterium]
MKRDPCESQVYRYEPPFKIKGMNRVTDAILSSFSPWIEVGDEEKDLEIIHQSDILEECYHLSVTEQGIKLLYGNESGLIYGLIRLGELKVSPHAFSLCDLFEQPRLKLRGLMVDISRDKLPSMATLKAICDFMMRVRMNHLELYIEGFPYRFPSFPNLPYDNPMTESEWLELERYANDRGIDLVPNVNTFGHMTAWLELPHFRHLAESESGYTIQGYPFPPSTLNPLDPESQRLAKMLIHDVSHVSASPFIHLNGDEPFELGQGKSRENVQKFGKGHVYYTYMAGLLEEARLHRKTPLIWGDVIKSHPEVLSWFDKRSIIVDWGYDRHYDFSVLARQMDTKKIPFLCAPGTNTWNAFLGRNQDMVASIDHAINTVESFKQTGIILTDWGDFSHPQPWTMSLLPIAYAGLNAWSGDVDIFKVSAFVDDAFKHTSKVALGQTIRILGDYANDEPFRIENQTLTFASWMYLDPNPHHPLKQKFDVWHEALSRHRIDPSSAQKIQECLSIGSQGLDQDPSIEAQELSYATKLTELMLILNQLVQGHPQ